MDIFSVADAAYLRHYPALLLSIVRNNPGRNFKFHLIWEGGNPHDLAMFHAFCERNNLMVDLIKIESSLYKAAYDLGQKGHVSHHAYYRWRIPDLLADARVALYLDLDISVIGAIDELLDTSLEGYAVAAVREPEPHKLGPFGVGSGDYFNSGVMLMNLQYWREHRVAEKALAFAREHPQALVAWDQCALNVVLQGQVKYLDPKWNCTLANAKEFNTLSPVIVHYTGRRKPWSEPWRQPYGIYYANYSQHTPWPVDYFGGARRARRNFNAQKALQPLSRWVKSLRGTIPKS